MDSYSIENNILYYNGLICLHQPILDNELTSEDIILDKDEIFKIDDQTINSLSLISDKHTLFITVNKGIILSSLFIDGVNYVKPILITENNAILALYDNDFIYLKYFLLNFDNKIFKQISFHPPIYNYKYAHKEYQIHKTFSKGGIRVFNYALLFITYEHGEEYSLKCIEVDKKLKFESNWQLETNSNS